MERWQELKILVCAQNSPPFLWVYEYPPKNWNSKLIRNIVDNWLERDLVTSSLNFSICESADSTRAFSASSKTTSLLSRFPSKLETFFWWRASL